MAESPYVRELAKETGKSTKNIQRLWDKAKEITVETYNVAEDDFSSREYEYTKETVRNMLGISESVIDPSFFLNSDLSAEQFIETVTSASFGNIGPDVNPPDDETEAEQVIEPAEKDYEVTKRETSDDDDSPETHNDDEERKRLYDTEEEEPEEEVIPQSEALDMSEIELLDTIIEKSEEA